MDIFVWKKTRNHPRNYILRTSVVQKTFFLMEDEKQKNDSWDFLWLPLNQGSCATKRCTNGSTLAG